MTDRIPCHRVVLDDHAPEERLLLAGSAMPAGWELSEVPGDPPRLGGSAEYYHVGEVIAARLRNVNCRLTRRGGEGEAGQLRVRLMKEGRIDGIVDGVPPKFRPGCVSIEGFSSDFALECANFGSDAIAFPSLDVKYDPTRHESVTIFDAETTNGRMLRAGMEAFFGMLPDATLPQMGEAVRMLVPLVTAALASVERDDDGPADFRKRQLVTMKTFIEHSLDNPELGADMLVAEFPVSRAVAYRMFQADGGLMRYIQSRRLARAATLLAFSDESTGIAEIARKVGLPNTSHFSRMFREKYGVPPSQARRSGNR